MNVINRIKIYEFDDEDVSPGLAERHLTVSNHWNDKRMINLQIEDGVVITVLAEELEKAIENALNK